MASTSTPAAIFYAAIAATFMVTTPAFCQAPTDAQRSAIRAQCRSDYEAHCASIPPGGAASLQCLQKNMSSLSPPCQSAVRALLATEHGLCWSNDRLRNVLRALRHLLVAFRQETQVEIGRAHV